MALEILGAMILEALFGVLLKGVGDAVSNYADFNSNLKRLHSTLNRLAPKIEDMERLNQLLKRPQTKTKKFASQLQDGKTLVQDCAKVHRWNYPAKCIYARKLVAMEKSLACIEAVAPGNLRDILGLLKKSDAKIDRTSTTGGDFKTSRSVNRGEVHSVKDFFVEFEQPMKKLKKLICKGKEKVVVVSAPGGFGKTTLAKKLCREDRIKAKFGKNIFFVTASKAPNIMVMIEKLFQQKGYRVPAFQTDEEAMHQLERMLTQIVPKPILLVFDDVWSGLESIMEVLKKQKSKMKILVTSRREFPGYDSTIKLEPLKNKEAKKLFCHSAFPDNGSSSIPDDLVDKIVKGCEGSPLALDVVGRALHGRPVGMWKHMLKQQSEKQRMLAKVIIDTWVGLRNDDFAEDAIDILGEDVILAILDELFNRSVVDHELIRKYESEINSNYKRPINDRSTDIMRDAVLWSIFVLLLATAALVVLKVYKYSFITVASWVAMLIVASAFLWGIILRLFNIEPNLSRMEISEESAVEMANKLRSWMEKGIQWMFRVAGEGEWFLFIGKVAALLLASKVASFFDLLTFLYIGIVVGMILRMQKVLKHG